MDSSSRLPRPSGIPRPSNIPRPSSIPRPSNLPLPSQKPSGQPSLRPAPSSERLRTKTSSSSLRAAASPRASSNPRPSIGIPARPAAKKDEDVLKKPTIGRPASRQARSRIQRPAISAISRGVEQEDDQLGDLDGFRASSRLSHRDAHSGEFEFGFDEGQEPREQPGAKQEKREPSLTDRTLESLSRIMQEPTSPTSRQTSWFTPTSPMGPPMRPASAMSFRASRPASRTAGTFRSSSQRPTTPTLRPPSSMSRTSSTTRSSYNQSATYGTPGRRSASAAPRSPAASTDSQPMSPPAVEPDSGSDVNPMSPGPMSPTELTSPGGRVSRTPLGSSKTMMARVPRTRPTVTSTFDDNVLSPTEDRSPKVERTFPTKPTASAKKASAKEEPADSTSKVKSSSAALREQIAKAKAARKAGQSKPAAQVTNEAPADGPEFDSFEDPFNQMPKGGEAVIKKRVDTARSDGRLNIANMGLSEIPKQVLTMYEYDPDAGVAWSESVDLVRFNAADNDIEKISDEVFPDIDPEEAAEDMDATGPQFGGLELLDLHGNILKELPVGLRRLERLTILNLSRNRLRNDVFEVISQISSLCELRLAENDLEGDLPESIGSLSNLEVLELQGNKIARLPESMKELVSLRVLNVNTNGLSSLPMETLAALPLVELSASKNALRGTFFPETVSEMPRLQSLDLSGNALTSLSSSSSLSMPALKSLNVSINRIDSLPDLTGWTSLLTLLAEENKLSEFPSGFTSLTSLKQANFNGNDISKIDPEIGFMESLDMLTLAANPLRERKFLTMNTEDLKRDLKMRHNPAAAAAEGVDKAEEIDETSNGIIPTNSMWTLKPSGILDLSSRSLPDLDEEEFTPVAPDCRQLVLHHNHFTYIPDAVALATDITLLDLSNNRLTTTFTDEVAFPVLRDLRLAANKLPSLDFLTANLSAPRLAHLDVSSNRLAGPLPILRARFPDLTTLLAGDNGIEEISREALDGLQVVGLANNSIGRIPPEVGLLWEKGLRSLEIEGNTFRVPNYATLQRGTEAVMSWLRDKIPADVLRREMGEVEADDGRQEDVSWEDETF